MSKLMQIYCCGCGKFNEAELKTGKDIYPHRDDLKDLPFWQCSTCGNYIGCHYKTKNKTKPLGVIPNKEIREIRKRIHSVIDPIWQSGKYTRREVYGDLSARLRKAFHTAEIRTIEEGELALKAAYELSDKYDASLGSLIKTYFTYREN